MPDETNPTQDETQVNKPDSTSGDKGGSTSKQVTLSQEDYQKLTNDASASRGRAEKLSSLEVENTRLKDELNVTRNDVDGLRSQLNQLQLDTVKDDPDKLKLYQATVEADRIKREAEATKREADRLKLEAEAERKKVVQDQFIISTGYYAIQYKVDPKVLEQRAKDLGITEREKVEILAQSMSGSVVNKQAAKKSNFTPDSGEGVTTVSTPIRGNESARDLISRGLKEREENES